jgi:ABC-type dipeptide/oligopeptide/nickel transport system permease subunit
MPALGPVIATNLVVSAGVAIAIQAGLSFLGLGDPSEVSWGAEISRAMTSNQISIGNLWVWWLLPVSLALAITLIGFTLIGVGLEPRFNPRWRRNR